MITPFQEEALKALRKAEHALQNAKHDLAGGFFLATANRTYYACYYCMTALLYTKEVVAKTHQGVRSRFSELFIKTGIFPVAAADTITLLFDYRQEADYDLDAEINADEAANLVEKAGEFLRFIKQYFEQTGG
jgi:uncharacterized protein (UPF0332 family)